MKNIILLAFLLFPVLIQAQILPNQTSEKDPEGTDAIYTQENGTLNKILFDSAFYFFIPRIKTTALSYSITSTDNPDSLRGYFVLDNTATWYYIASDASSVSLGGGGGGGTTQLLSYSGTNLSISGGNTVSLANLLDNTDTQLTEAEVDAFVANNGYLTSYTETDPVWTADKPSYATTAYVDANDDTGTDDQTAAEVSVTPAGNLTSTNVQDALEEIQTQVDGLGGGGTADGVATAGTYNAGTKSIDVTVASPGSNFSIDVSALLDNTDAQAISLDGNTLNISGNVSAVDLSPYLDNTDAQAISLAGTILSITGNASTVDLSAIQDGTGTDDQTASEVPVTPIGNLNSTDVQAALEELQTDIDAITGGAGDGVITAASYDAVDEEIDVTVAAPGTSFSFDVSALTKLTESEVDAFVANNGYLTSYTETDPVYSAAPASGITSLNITNWNTAYEWGDHSTQGYLTSEVDGSATNEVNTGMSWTDATNTVSVTDANGTVSVIITGFQETLTGSETVFDGWDKDASNDLVDADFGTAGLMATDGAGTYSIVTDNSSNWNTAYSWGDHAAINNTTAGNLPYWDGDSWENTAVSYSGVGGVTVGTLLNLSTVNTAGTIDGVLTLEGGVVTQTSVASLQDGTGTDDQQISYSEATYAISLEDGGSADLSQLAQTIGIVGESLAISGVTTGASVPIINTVESAVSGSTTVAVDLESAYNRVVQLDMTSGGSSVTLSVSNPVSGGVYTFHFQNVTNHDIDFPATFLKADGTTWDGGSTVNYSTADWLTCYFDGTNFYCK